MPNVTWKLSGSGGRIFMSASRMGRVSAGHRARASHHRSNLPTHSSSVSRVAPVCLTHDAKTHTPPATPAGPRALPPPLVPRRGRARACSSLLLTIFSLRRIPVHFSAPAVSRFICKVGDADASNRLSASSSVNSFHQTLLSVVAVICSFEVN